MTIHGHFPIIRFVKIHGKQFESHNMAVLYQNVCYNEVCYKGTAMYTLYRGFLTTNKPVQEILLHMAYESIKGSDEPWHMGSLARYQKVGT